MEAPRAGPGRGPARSFRRGASVPILGRGIDVAGRAGPPRSPSGRRSGRFAGLSRPRPHRPHHRGSDGSADLREKPLNHSTLTTLDLRPLTGCIGAEVGGVDLSRLDDAIWEEIRSAWLDHLVLFFPDQHLDADAHIALGARLGELEIHP